MVVVSVIVPSGATVTVGAPGVMDGGPGGPDGVVVMVPSAGGPGSPPDVPAPAPVALPTPVAVPVALPTPSPAGGGGLSAAGGGGGLSPSQSTDTGYMPSSRCEAGSVSAPHFFTASAAPSFSSSLSTPSSP